jgi:hypothetical protein
MILHSSLLVRVHWVRRVYVSKRLDFKTVLVLFFVPDVLSAYTHLNGIQDSCL